MSHAQTSEMLFGALVSDAASLGLHWLYDPDRIADIVARQGGQSAFTPVDAANFEGVPGYFAHASRQSGMLTQYGEVLLLAIQSMNAQQGAFDVAAYQSAFVAHFGPGGSYQGYIDRPTREALINIAKEVTPSGIDDDQNPAIARLPAILAGYHGREDLAQMVTQSMQVTNMNDVAAAYSTVFTDVLSRVMQDENLGDALIAAVRSADTTIKSELSDALSTTDQNATEFAGAVGRACNLPASGPVMFHILKHSNSYRDAVERNILAGGDSAGRSILIGAIMARVHGVATPTGVPLSWALKLNEADTIWAACQRLAGAAA